VTDEKTASPAKKDRPEKTVKTTTPGFSGLAASSAVAQCPAGWTCTGGGVEPGHPDQTVTGSRKTSDKTGWEGGVTGGPSGGTAVVYAECIKDDEDEDEDGDGGKG
jgi:hypothetical protein